MAAGRDEPPAVARWRVSRALRRARLDAGLIQGEVARRLAWSLSKVQRIESGDVAVSITDLRALLGIYDVDDEARIQRLAKDAAVSRRQRWAIPAEYRDHLTPGLRHLLQFEAQATVIRAYQPFLVPGPMQTPAMAEHLLNGFDKSLSEQDRKVRFDVRMMRGKRIAEALDAPTYLLMLDAALLSRVVGNRAMMADQLESLAESAQRPNVHVRIVKQADGAEVGMLGPFTILNLGDEPDEAVLYREAYTNDGIAKDSDTVDYYRTRFEEVWHRCHTSEESLGLIRGEGASLRASMIRDP